MEQAELINRLKQYINDPKAKSEEAFNAMALEVFTYQFKNNIPFQRYCQQKAKTLRTVKRWQDIPAVPINGFKELTLSCSDPMQAQAVFMTSGTTNPEKRGKHYHPTLEIYDLSMIVNFADRVMRGQTSIRMGILFPTEQKMPNSSLAHYLALALRQFGTNNSGYLFNEDGVDLDGFFRTMQDVHEKGEPYALLGATFSFVHVMDACNRLGKSFSLPKGSFILDTGGFKGQSRELGMEEFYSEVSTLFGIERSACLSMYGMTELSTQFYDHGNVVTPSPKSGPHWIRSRIVHPLTGEEMPKGQTGILIHCDLANFNSVTSILTEDLGIQTDEGFLLLGRAQGAEAKGCSLAVEELLNAARGSIS